MSDSLAAALATLKRRYGPKALRRGGPAEVTEVWATGVPAIDDVLAPGGLPRGRLTLLAAGAKSGPTGRLTLLQSLAAIASHAQEVGYVDLAGTLDPGFLADLGADLDACLVLDPGASRWARGLAMGRSLVAAGLPWVAVALGGVQPRSAAWEHALTALVEAVARRGAVCVVAASAPAAAPLAYASSLTLSCSALGWQRSHGDVTGLRVRLTTTKSKVSAPEVEATVLLRYPRAYAVAEVVGLPAVVPSVAARTDAALPRLAGMRG
jgi:hypothetical protein